MRIARKPEEWSAAIMEALKPEENSPERVQCQHSVAAEHDWDRLVTWIARLFCEDLGPEEPKLFETEAFGWLVGRLPEGSRCRGSDQQNSSSNGARGE
jgi:hypothetical protein